MPHSTGGGGGGGGFHGGSSGSSGGWHSSTSNKPFAGATDYGYYDRQGNVKHFYSTGGIPKYNFAQLLLIIFLLPFYYIMGKFVIPDVINGPQPLKVEDNQIVIEDRADLFTDSEELQLIEHLQSFTDETGIPMMIETLHTSDWHKEYYSLENYALNEYTVLCSDESHWLIVYSVPETGESADNWKWESIAGDDTVHIITESKANKFGKALQNKLAQRPSEDVCNSLIQNFDEFTPKFMKEEVATKAGIAFFVLLLMLFTAVFIGVPDMIKAIKYKKAFKMPANAKECTCPYCGKTYVSGVSLRCPHCNADLRRFELKNDE